jgi:hypothetical protein
VYYDLRTVSYEGFLDFIFGHPVAPQASGAGRRANSGPSGCWYDSIDLEVDFEPARNCEYLTLLFCDPQELNGRYSKAQIAQGFWWMQKSFNDGSAADVLWTTSLPAQRRAAMVESMYFLYADLFASLPLGRAAHMWWENLAKDIPGQGGGPKYWADREQLEEVIFQTLAKLLELEAENCRIDALHGLNHLTHPDKPQLIRDYLAKRPGLDETHRLYAEKAITGALA